MSALTIEELPGGDRRQECEICERAEALRLVRAPGFVRVVCHWCASVYKQDADAGKLPPPEDVEWLRARVAELEAALRGYLDAAALGCPCGYEITCVCGYDAAMNRARATLGTKDGT